MYELTINGEVYSFRFGFGWYRDINKTVKSKADQVTGHTSEMGVHYALAGLMDRDPEVILTILDIGNKYADKPRITKAQLEEFLEDEETPFDDIAEELLDFFMKSHLTKATLKRLYAMMGMSVEAEQTQASK